MLTTYSCTLTIYSYNLFSQYILKAYSYTLIICFHNIFLLHILVLLQYTLIKNMHSDRASAGIDSIPYSYTLILLYSYTLILLYSYNNYVFIMGISRKYTHQRYLHR